jgi:hypothetical protein
MSALFIYNNAYLCEILEIVVRNSESLSHKEFFWDEAQSW